MQQRAASDAHGRGPNRLLRQGMAALVWGALFVAVSLLAGARPAGGAEVLAVAGGLLCALGLGLLVAFALARRRQQRAWADTDFGMPTSDWSAGTLATLTPRQFEALCTAIYQQSGFEVRSRSRTEPGAMDLRLQAARMSQAMSVVRCQHLAAGRVELDQVLRYYAVMAAHTLRRGTFATNRSFSPEALRFAADHGIAALDGGTLLALINRRSPEQQQALLDTTLG